MKTFLAFILGALATAVLTLSWNENTADPVPLVHADYIACRPVTPFIPTKPNFHPFSRRPDNA